MKFTHTRTPGNLHLRLAVGSAGDETGTADARLIAAAPALLAACELIMENHEGYLRHEMVGDWIILRDAIAKAKGETA